MSPITDELPPQTVHLRCFDLHGEREALQAYRTLLSSLERQRADRFVFPRDQVRYTIAHGVLRQVLSRYCGIPPADLRFEISGAGKPALVGAGDLRFNLSHSEDRALVGVSRGLELGVDLERVRPNVDALSISRHYFFGRERAAIESAAPAEREGAFFRYWVAKEAVLKAQGIGLGFPLDRFCVDFAPQGDTARIETLDPTTLAADWTVRVLPCGAEWAAAVAARGSTWIVVTDWSNL